MNNIAKEKYIFSAFFVILFIFFKDNPFFWDSTQLSSLQAHFYFNSNFNSFFLTDDIDSGHPPTMGILLAFLWKISGRQLWVGHALVLVFCIGIVWQLHELCQKMFAKHHFWIMLVVLSEATFLAQSSLVSPDICLIFCFLTVLNGILCQKNWLIVLGNIGLCLISTRGAMLGLALAIFSIFHTQYSLKLVLYFVYGFLLVLAFQGTHYMQKGWILYYPNSPWQPCFEKTFGIGYFRNLLIMAWRFCDNGRIMAFLGFGIAFIFSFKKVIKLPLFMLFICVFVCTAAPLLQYTNLLAHRYLLPCYLLINLLLCGYVANYFAKYAIAIYIALVLVQLSGHCWIYPDKIAKGWDASLAYIGYSKILNHAQDFIVQHNVSKINIYSAFPLLQSNYYTNLDTDKSTFIELVSMKNSKYVLYSNLINDFSDSQLDSLKSNFEPIFSEKNFFVRIILYKNITY